MVTKLSPARWRVIFDGEVSLTPSVAATCLPCNSHYYITRGEVDWDRNLNAVRASGARAADRRAVEEQRVEVAGGWLARLRRHLGKRGQQSSGSNPSAPGDTQSAAARRAPTSSAGMRSGLKTMVRARCVAGASPWFTHKYQREHSGDR